jgi:hypothetical protein
MKKMKTLKKMMLMGMMMLVGATAMYAEETNVTNEVDTTYIKLDENLEPINFVNSTKEELEAAVGELETILETDNFQLYAAGDYTYKIENGVVTSMAIHRLGFIFIWQRRICGALRGRHQGRRRVP